MEVVKLTIYKRRLYGAYDFIGYTWTLTGFFDSCHCVDLIDNGILCVIRWLVLV